MDKYISAKLDSFNFSKSQKELFVDIITYVAAKVTTGSIDLSNFATKNDLHNSVHGLELDINTVRDTAVEANRIANNNIDEINNINDNIIPNFYTKTETDKKVNDRIQQVVGAAPEALDTLEEIATRLEGDSDAITAINGVLEGKVSNTTFDTFSTNVNNNLSEINNKLTEKADTAIIPTKVSQLERDDIYIINGNDIYLEEINNTITPEKMLQIFGSVSNFKDAIKKGKQFVYKYYYDNNIMYDYTITVRMMMLGSSQKLYFGKVYGNKYYEFDLNYKNDNWTNITVFKVSFYNDKYIDNNFYTKSQTNININTAIQNLIGTAPEALDTLGEIAEKLNNNDNTVAAITNQITELNTKVDSKADVADVSNLNTEITNINNKIEKYHPSDNGDL